MLKPALRFGLATGSYILTLEHPLANNSPSALVNVTPRGLNANSYLSDMPTSLGVRYNSTIGRWQIIVQYDLDGDIGSKGFNVFILKS